MLMTPLFAKDGAGSTLAAVVSKRQASRHCPCRRRRRSGRVLLPGNHVDVVATSKDEHGAAYVAETVLSNIKVLAVDQTASANSNEPVVVRAVTLEVTPGGSRNPSSRAKPPARSNWHCVTLSMKGMRATRRPRPHSGEDRATSERAWTLARARAADDHHSRHKGRS